MRRSQRGVALLIALIFLVVLTLIGLTSMRTASLEEKMTSNQKDYYLAFEAAELALRAAETQLAGLTSLNNFSASPTNGLYAFHSLSSKVWTTVDWNSNAISVTGLAKQTTAEAPKYIIEFLTTITKPVDDLNMDNDTDNKVVGATYNIFRITARGKSGRGGVVFLQENYGVRGVI
ncbi:pilus assembly PilX family protein [Gynuella sp.]|uniref:pilus assembly PilX family protein n=1 Tax=Gynuella sp. TaxID=2969146 RepID=UPI003D14D65C